MSKLTSLAFSVVRGVAWDTRAGTGTARWRADGAVRFLARAVVVAGALVADVTSSGQSDDRQNNGQGTHCVNPQVIKSKLVISEKRLIRKISEP